MLALLVLLDLRIPLFLHLLILHSLLDTAVGVHSLSLPGESLVFDDALLNVSLDVLVHVLYFRLFLLLQHGFNVAAGVFTRTHFLELVLVDAVTYWLLKGQVIKLRGFLGFWLRLRCFLLLLNMLSLWLLYWNIILLINHLINSI